eukprot:2320553-Rhodomonas_salina.2
MARAGRHPLLRQRFSGQRAPFHRQLLRARDHNEALRVWRRSAPRVWRPWGDHVCGDVTRFVAILSVITVRFFMLILT